MEHAEYIRTINVYGDMIYRVAYSYCGNQSDAEDVVQNVFLKLFLNRKEFSDEEYRKRWLIRVTINEAKNLCASFWRKKTVSLENSREQFPQQEFFNEKERWLYDAVMGLPWKYRAVVYLYYYEDYSIREISKILGIRETTIQTQLMRARAKLKEVLKEDWEDE